MWASSPRSKPIVYSIRFRYQPQSRSPVEDDAGSITVLLWRRRRHQGRPDFDDGRAQPDDLDLRHPPRRRLPHLVPRHHRPHPPSPVAERAREREREREDRGPRRFSLRDHSCHRCVEFAWDLSRASFHTGGSGRPEPASGFFVAVAFDGEMLLVAGDLVEEAYKKTKARRPIAPFSNPTPTARREHVVLGNSGGPRSYRTVARFGGRNREISIELGPKDREPEAGMAVAVDGETVVHVQRLRWKFRGTEKVEVESGARMQVSWDLHDWLFKSTAEAALSDAAVPTAAERGHAVFVFRFEEEEEEDAKAAEGHPGKVSAGPYGGHSGNGSYKGTVFGGHPGKTRNWSESSSNGGGGAETTAAQRKRKSRRKDLLKTTSSSSSTSSASSASSSTVMEWASQEEMELQRSDGFSLLVYIREN
ncbi:hypothetical protein MUK42_05292 [Musa troglodytarum]|uniref:DUF868 family protein n=1 Tax=Musa troglodytarum TaxID=320322 RepID=A0A9E7HB12_9LILI|nr:hypothetical protein MUK42_05292 [Musa troglodytarum]